MIRTFLYFSLVHLCNFIHSSVLCDHQRTLTHLSVKFFYLTTTTAVLPPFSEKSRLIVHSQWLHQLLHFLLHTIEYRIEFLF